jgi:hypothetical protein
MKMQELRVMARTLSINSFGKKKADLIREIQRAEGNFDCFGTAERYCDQLDCCFRAICIPLGKMTGRPKAAKLA